MRIDDIATRQVVTVSPTAALPETLAIMRWRRFHHLPVIDGGRLVGIVSMRNILFHAGDLDADAPDAGRVIFGDAAPTVADIMIRNVVTTAPETGTSQAARTMLDRHIGSLPIIEDGRLVGIITATDLLRLFRQRCDLDRSQSPCTEPVRDHMQTRLITISPDESLRAATRVLLENRIRHLLVTDNDELIGILADGDVRLAIGADRRARISHDAADPNAPGPPPTVRGAMAAHPTVIAPDATLAEAAEQMVTRTIHALPVVDGAALEGILTETDMLRACVRMDFESTD